MRCVRFDRWRGATKEHSRRRSVTEEQQSHRSNLAQPCGLRSFSPLPALLAPHRPLTGMLVAGALTAAKNPGNACIEISLSQYYSSTEYSRGVLSERSLGTRADFGARLCAEHQSQHTCAPKWFG